MDEIAVVWGRGDAGTGLSAVDAALAETGLHNYNLVSYSSVVPAGATVSERGRVDLPYPVGAPVGTVLAVNESGRTEETVAAGLGWLEATEGGVFMESAAGSADACRADLERKLADARRLRDWDWRDDGMQVVEGVVDGNGAVVVAAVYGRLAYAGPAGREPTKDI
jgi:arginine decarboxylase